MSDNFESSLNNARELLSNQKFAEAAQELEKVFSVEPSHVGALCLLADTVLHLGQAEQALALLAEAVKSGGTDASLLEQMALILNSLKRWEEEADFLMFAAEASPDNEVVRQKAVSALLRLGRQTDADSLTAPAASPEAVKA